MKIVTAPPGSGASAMPAGPARFAFVAGPSSPPGPKTPVPATVYAPPAGATVTTYSYAYINGHKVIVDNKTRAVVAIVG